MRRIRQALAACASIAAVAGTPAALFAYPQAAPGSPQGATAGKGTPLPAAATGSPGDALPAKTINSARSGLKHPNATEASLPDMGGSGTGGPADAPVNTSRTHLKHPSPLIIDGNESPVICRAHGGSVVLVDGKSQCVPAGAPAQH